MRDLTDGWTEGMDVRDQQKGRAEWANGRERQTDEVTDGRTDPYHD